jgi:hypothetical protein
MTLNVRSLFLLSEQIGLCVRPGAVPDAGGVFAQAALAFPAVS